MSLAKFEVWVHDHVLKSSFIRHIIYGAYQRLLWLFSPKIKSEGEIVKLTPDDGCEYLFGYYDKCPWSPNGKFLLALRTKNASKKADSCEESEIVIIDMAQKKISKVATTHCWNVQQGCMLQWMSDEEILFNDFRDNRYVCIIKNLKTEKERIINMPVYCISSDKSIALSLDFSRLDRLRPGYGYCNIEEATKNKKCPDSPCIWKINLCNGDISPILKYTDFASFESKNTMDGAEHKVNHIMISPNGTRFMVLHRWIKNNKKYTRLVTCNTDGTEMYNLSDDDFVSHCCWKNNDEILSYLNKCGGGKGYYLLTDKTHDFKRVWPKLVMDGHPSYAKDEKHVVTDTYPDRKRMQSLFVMEGDSIKRIARVFSPFKYSGNVRCDLHPRWSNDGRSICFDGSFDGKRAVYICFFKEEDDRYVTL